MMQQQIAANYDQLEYVSDEITTLFKAHNKDVSHAETMEGVRLAMHELLVNIMRHSYEDKGGEIDVEMKIKWGRFSAELTDTGLSFDPNAVPEPDADALQEHGFGLFLIDQLMDKVEYDSRDGVNHWRLSKKL